MYKIYSQNGSGGKALALRRCGLLLLKEHRTERFLMRRALTLAAVKEYPRCPWGIAMRKRFLASLLFLLLAFSLSQLAFFPSLQAQEKKPAEPLKLKVGDTAPEFTLLAFDGKDLKKVSLKDFRGKQNVALAFYVFAFTGG